MNQYKYEGIPAWWAVITNKGPCVPIRFKTQVAAMEEAQRLCKTTNSNVFVAKMVCGYSPNNIFFVGEYDEQF